MGSGLGARAELAKHRTPSPSGWFLVVMVVDYFYLWPRATLTAPATLSRPPLVNVSCPIHTRLQLRQANHHQGARSHGDRASASRLGAACVRSLGVS